MLTQLLLISCNAQRITNLHAVDVVAVVAYQPGELDLADLVELLQSEGGGPAAVLVPEAVAEPEVVELLSDDAGEGGADHGSGQGHLGDAGGPHVDVVHAGVSPAMKVTKIKSLTSKVMMADCPRKDKEHIFV